jgi:hypothetical protein
VHTIRNLKLKYEETTYIHTYIHEYIYRIRKEEQNTKLWDRKLVAYNKKLKYGKIHTYIHTCMHIQDPQEEQKTKLWDKKLVAYNKKRKYEEKHVQIAEEKEKKSKAAADKRQKEAMSLQTRVDEIKKVCMHALCVCMYVCIRFVMKKRRKARLLRRINGKRRL